jgi:hypothetical protein
LAGCCATASANRARDAVFAILVRIAFVRFLRIAILRHVQESVSPFVNVSCRMSLSVPHRHGQCQLGVTAFDKGEPHYFQESELHSGENPYWSRHASPES